MPEIGTSANWPMARPASSDPVTGPKEMPAILMSPRM